MPVALALLEGSTGTGIMPEPSGTVWLDVGECQYYQYYMPVVRRVTLPALLVQQIHFHVPVVHYASLIKQTRILTRHKRTS